MIRRLAPLALAIPLTGCLVLPFGVHVNRPFPTGEPLKLRAGIGWAQFPQGQGAVDQVTNGGGNAVNPVPTDARSGKNGTVILDAALGLHQSVDLGYGARGVWVLWEPVRMGSFSVSVSPSAGRTKSSADTTFGTNTRHEKGTLFNVNGTVLAVWRSSPEKADTAFLYGGGGLNMFSTRISVEESSPPLAAEDKDSATAPTVLVGFGTGFATTLQINLEVGATMVKQRTGRSDTVPTGSVVLTWAGKLF